MKRKQIGIQTQLIIMMTIVCFTVIASAFLSAYLVYLVFYPDSEIIEEVQQEEYYFELSDFIWILLMAFIGLIVSTFLAFRISKKMLISINALGHTAQKITDGDLTARIAPNPKTNFAELIQLEQNINLMAEQLEKKQSNLMLWNAGIAHELRTPVTILKGRLQGVLDGVFEPNEELIHTLLKQTENLSHLIEDLRLLSLIEHDHLKLNIQKVETSTLIKEVFDEFSTELANANLNPILDLQPATIQCDPFRLQQVIAALLDNMTRYSNAGNLYIKTQISDNCWLFTIEDEGPGIPESEQARIFESFYRANHPSKDSKQGTGLGLTIIKKLVEAHQGTFSYRLTENGGSCFGVGLTSNKK